MYDKRTVKAIPVSERPVFQAHRDLLLVAHFEESIRSIVGAKFFNFDRFTHLTEVRLYVKQDKRRCK